MSLILETCLWYHNKQSSLTTDSTSAYSTSLSHYLRNSGLWTVLIISLTDGAVIQN